MTVVARISGLTGYILVIDGDRAVEDRTKAARMLREAAQARDRWITPVAPPLRGEVVYVWDGLSGAIEPFDGVAGTWRSRQSGGQHSVSRNGEHA